MVRVPGPLRTLFLLAGLPILCSWGFFAHRTMTRLAVFSLPPEMITLYKKNLDYLMETSVNPDRRRYADPLEGPRHFIDLEHYGDSALVRLPRYYKGAEEQIGNDSLNEGGRLPWQIQVVYYRLREAFLLRDPESILKLSGELGHYLADAHVPLHTTENYDGQLTGQEGIHAFWESRLPELYTPRYDFLVGKASYVDKPVDRIWKIIAESHQEVDSVLNQERELALTRGDKKYNYETRGRQTIKVVSRQYADEYHQRLHGMVERRMRSTVKTLTDFWYSAWVDAGQPDLKSLVDYVPSREELERRRAEVDQWKKGTLPTREGNVEN